jgi:hypothetical protein
MTPDKRRQSPLKPPPLQRTGPVGEVDKLTHTLTLTHLTSPHAAQPSNNKLRRGSSGRRPDDNMRRTRSRYTDLSSFGREAGKSARGHIHPGLYARYEALFKAANQPSF